MKSKISLALLLLFYIPLQAQNNLKILSSNRSSLLIEYTPEYSDTSIREFGNQKFRKIEISDAFYPNPFQFGLPAIPEKQINIAVPSELGNTIEVEKVVTKQLSGKIIPKPKPVIENKLISYSFETVPEYNNYKAPEEFVTFGSFGYIRDVPTTKIIIHPVKFDPAQNKITLVTRIIFRVNFSPNQKISNSETDHFLDGVLVNQNVARFWAKSRNRLTKKQIVNSVLAEGKWVKFEVPEEGIYKISKADLSKYGINPSVDPRTIKIYNNSGKMLSEVISDPRPFDLQEIAIEVVGQDDGTFDDGDFILFYGHGINFWEYEAKSKNIQRFRNIYSDKNYYWITSGGNAGKRVTDKSSLNEPVKYDQKSSKGFAFWEEDKINIAKTGKDFYGDDFSQSITSRTYINKLDGRISSTPIRYNFKFANASSSTLGLQITENSTQIFNQFLGGVTQSYVDGIPYNRTAIYNGTLPENRSVLKFTFTPTSVTTLGYLDYIEIRYDKELKAFNDQLLFFSKDTSSVIEYQLSGFSNTNIRVYDVSDYSNVKRITNPIVQSGGDFIFQASEAKGKVSKYIAIGNDNFKTPINPVEVGNSNLHGITQGAKFIIITVKDFEPAAQRLKNYRESGSLVNMSTIIVDIEQIFNEFSGGLRDITGIRDFLKYAFENWQIKPEYVLFFGKGTYDYKNVENKNNNFIPVWETNESLSLIPSFTTDDYFVNLTSDSNVDLASGRITAESLDDANTAVDKIIKYETNSDKGTWRNLITLVADDGFTSTTFEGAEHTAPSETLSNSKIPLSFDLNKIYMATYPVVITSVGRRMPDVNKAIINAINDGTLILNYVGHGNPELWAHEVVFDKTTSFSQLHNNRYFFLSAATCDFGYFDLPNFRSAAEELVLMKDAGSIAAFTATRLVYSTLNHSLMYQFFTDLLTQKRDTLNLNIPIGRANFLTKQIFDSINDQKYHILGDPTLRLLVPQFSARLDSLNGSVINRNIQIKALQNVKVDGTVVKPDNSVWSGFNGEGILTVFDSERIINVPSINNFQIKLPGGIIFKGRVSINDAKYSENFVVPKDISYENKRGKILFYFTDNNVDGIGFTNSIIVGDTDTSIVNDGKGPEIDVFFDGSPSRGTVLVNPNSELIVKLRDETGLNTTGTGVGHKLEGILNDKPDEPIDFSNFFTGDLNSGGKSGEIRYKLNNFDPADYKLKVKAWDVFNNFSDATSYFTVVENNGLEVKNVFNYPNPFSNNTTFTFQQNLNKVIDVRIKIYTIAGRLIKEIERKNIIDKFVTIDWDGRDEDGDRLGNGTYLYKLIVNSADGQFNKSIIGKLAVIR